MMHSFEVGIVVGTYPDGNSIDVLMEDGSRLTNVQILSRTGTDGTGEVDLPDVGGPADDTRWLFNTPLGRIMRAVIGPVHDIPFCFGFLPPQENQLSFTDKNRRIMRHASDVYTSIDDAGNFELYHPSGTYLRIGSSATHEDLTGKDVDKKWAIARNTSSAPHVHLGVSNAGATVATLDFDPSGNVALVNNGTTSITTTGNVSLTTQGSVTATAKGDVSVSTQGNASIAAQGNATLSASAAVEITGGSGVSISTTGSTATTITSSGPVSLKAPSINLN
jgi:hypothetical protein